MEKQGSEKITNVSKVTQLVRRGAGSEELVTLVYALSLVPCLISSSSGLRAPQGQSFISL